MVREDQELIWGRGLEQEVKLSKFKCSQESKAMCTWFILFDAKGKAEVLETFGLHARLKRRLTVQVKHAWWVMQILSAIGIWKKEKPPWIMVVRKGLTWHVKLGFSFEECLRWSEGKTREHSRKNDKSKVVESRTCKRYENASWGYCNDQSVKW